MNLHHHLRISIPGQAALERAIHHYPGREIIEKQEDARYLQLQLTDEYGRQVSAFFNIDSWLQNMDSHLPGIPWLQVPLGYLASWLNTLQLSFLVEGTLWTVEHTSLPEQAIPNTLLSLVAEPCSILCTEWPTELSEECEEKTSLSWLPLTLRYVLGTSQIPLSALSSLMPGDLLLVRQEVWHLKIGQYKLFSFSYQGNDEVIVKESIFENEQTERNEEEHLLDWTNLPVDLEFLLDSNEITLGELNHIDVGSLLHVSSGAEQRIKIYLNRKFFAVGELVALEGGGLAIEINQISMHPEKKTSHSDVE